MNTELTSEFAKLGPWVFQFRIDGQDYGGAISAIGDARVGQFFRFAPEAATILELGSLEGAHTFILAQRPGVKRVFALEGREFNLRKSRFVQELLHVSNAEFAQANLESSDLAAFGKFDAVFCSGLIYHLPEPWKLISQLPALAPNLFIWTHYAADTDAEIVFEGLAREGPPRRRRSRSAQWHVGDGHLAHAGIADRGADQEWICERPSDR